MIYGFGKVCLDYLCETRLYPKENGISYISSSQYRVGGMAANALKAASHFGAATSLASFIGNDEQSNKIIKKLKEENINTELLTSLSGSSDYSYIILTGENRTIFHYHAPGERRWNTKENVFTSEDILLTDFTVIDGLKDVLEKAKTAGATTVMDISPGNQNYRIKEFLPLIDYCIPSREWAQIFTGKNTTEKMGQELIKLGAGKVIITDGGHGAFMYSPLERVRMKPPKIEVVDSNGAGDTFHGAFCYALSNKLEFKNIMAFALLAATYKCKGRGISDSLPDAASIKKEIEIYLEGELYNEL